MSLMASSSNHRFNITHLLAPGIPAIKGPRDETLPQILIERKSEKFKLSVQCTFSVAAKKYKHGSQFDFLNF